MTFAQPLALFGLLLIPVLLAFLAWARRRRQAALGRLGSPALVAALAGTVNQRGRRVAARLWIVAIALVVLALARPAWGSQSEAVRQQGIQVMVALDVSDSMLAEDIKPSRLERAKLEIADLMSRLDGDEVGLVLFSGAAFIQFPLTSDYDVARTFLDGARPGVISRGGTVIGEAIRTALTGFDQRRPGQKVIVLYTDGEDPDSDAAAAAAEARDQGVLVYTVGLGTPEGAPIPVQGPDGTRSGVKRDQSGQVVMSKLDATGLERITERGGGRHFQAGVAGGGFDSLVAELAGLQAGETESRMEVQQVERFQLALGAAVLLLIAIELIPDRRKAAVAGLAPAAATAGNRRPTAAILLAASLGLGLGLSACSRPSPSALNQAGNQAYQAQDYAAAAEVYETALKEAPDSAALAYNLGNTAFRQEDVDNARRQLDQALTLDSTGSLAPSIFFNLGHLAYNLKQHDASVGAYKEVLRLQPDNADAKVNLELALRAQAEEQQQEQQQQDQQDQQQANQDQQQEQQDQQQQDQNQQNQQQGQQQQQNQDQQQAQAQSQQDPQGQNQNPQQQPGQPTQPSSQPTQSTGSTGSTTSTPTAPAAQAGAPGTPGTPAAGSPPGGTARRQVRGLTPVEARRLLRAIGGNARTLQEFLQQLYVVPEGAAPEQDW